MWYDKKVSVVLTSYREKNSIREIINGFFNSGVVDEVIVVDNNAEPGSVEEVQKTKAKLFFEKCQGHGHALKTGMAAASGDYIILCEGDSSYNPNDIFKFLTYAAEFPVVFGTRTNTSLTGPESDMFYLRKIADVFEAKVIQYLFGSYTLTDIGCTYKLLRHDIIKNLETKWIKGDSHFVTEITLQIAARGIPFIEIPIALRKRVGHSAVIDSFWNMAKWGVKLFIFILIFWIRWQWKKLFHITRM